MRCLISWISVSRERKKMITIEQSRDASAIPLPTSNALDLFNFGCLNQVMWNSNPDFLY